MTWRKGSEALALHNADSSDARRSSRNGWVAGQSGAVIGARVEAVYGPNPSGHATRRPGYGGPFSIVRMTRSRAGSRNTMAWAAIFLAACLVPGQAFDALATTIRTVTMDEMLRGAQLIFHDKVIDARPRLTGSGLVVTDVRYRVVDVVKGNVDGTVLTLTFLGGSADGVATVVSEQTIPTGEEEGIYFVESATRPMVNPLFGWSQGRFTIQSNASGNDVVLGADGQPVTELISTDSSGGDGSEQHIAKSLRSAEGPDDLHAMTPQAFKSQLRVLLEASSP